MHFVVTTSSKDHVTVTLALVTNGLLINWSRGGVMSPASNNNVYKICKFRFVFNIDRVLVSVLYEQKCCMPMFRNYMYIYSKKFYENVYFKHAFMEWLYGSQIGYLLILTVQKESSLMAGDSAPQYSVPLATPMKDNHIF